MGLRLEPVYTLEKKRKWVIPKRGWDTSCPCPGLPLARGPGCRCQLQHLSLGRRCQKPDVSSGFRFPRLRTTQTTQLYSSST